MEKHITNTKALSRMFQLLDSSFPSGSFVHSFGLEPHIILNKVSTPDTLKRFLDNLLIDQYQALDFVFAKRMYDHLANDKLHLLLKEEEQFSAMLPYEYAKASKELGANYLKQIGSDITKHTVQKYYNGIKAHHYVGHELAVLSAYAFELTMDLDLFLLLWAKKNLTTIAMTSLKISRIKPSEVQQLLFTFDDALHTHIASSGHTVNNFNPLFEEIIYQHEDLQPKMFTT